MADANDAHSSNQTPLQQEESKVTDVAAGSAAGAPEVKHDDSSADKVADGQVAHETHAQGELGDKLAIPQEGGGVEGSSATDVAAGSAAGAPEVKHDDSSADKVADGQVAHETHAQGELGDKLAIPQEGGGVAGSSATDGDGTAASGAGQENKEVVPDGAPEPLLVQEGVEIDKASGIPLAGDSEHLEETLLEALEKKHDAEEATEADAPQYRFGWWRLSQVAPEPEFEIRHVVHYKDGVQMGPARLERRRAPRSRRSGYNASVKAVAKPRESRDVTSDAFEDWRWQKLVDLVAGPCDPPQLSGCLHVSYNTAKAAVQDLTLSGGSGSRIFVSTVAPAGPARRAGVLVGFQLMALNGRDFSKGLWLEEPGDQLLPCLPADAKVQLDLLDPTPQGHGITTLADRVARMPLLRPFFR